MSSTTHEGVEGEIAQVLALVEGAMRDGSLDAGGILYGVELVDNGQGALSGDQHGVVGVTSRLDAEAWRAGTPQPFAVVVGGLISYASRLQAGNEGVES